MCQMYKLTYHASVERLERLLYINLNIGIGEEVCRSRGRHGNTEILTSTGVVLVLGENDIVITGFIAHMNKAIGLWRHSERGNTPLPRDIYKTILKNETAYKKTQEIDDIFGYSETNGKYEFFRKKVDIYENH